MDILQALCEKHCAQKGTLYVVATPIGNLSDLTLRAIGILQTCDCIACETPSITRQLLAHLQIRDKKLFTYRDAGERQSAQHLLQKLQSGLSVALVSDAGTPTISDPGFRVLRLCHHENIPIVPIPGPSAAIASLSVAGFPSDRFLFLGFLPLKKGHRQKILESYRHEPVTLILYESPHRVLRLFECLQKILEPQREIFVARELTKLNETLYRGTLAQLAQTIFINAPRGEYVILISPLL
ncbi:MAG: 16S rRNA (cytidine(1402)-2'-O)-methyltransferase [Puniceicoccales bacterium]|jgi:16S rRNA (cytidine1402-2'-O)-methyltransferase|nr:16S rRNA (cytidine(1402)-2'-O)-methyltransferase [Puniceicoccales bacterium]